eukprot:3775397-Alexandrium_andersonii.AAC.1
MAAVEGVIKFLGDAGGRVSRTKSLTLASTVTLRDRLRRTHSRALGGPLPVSSHTRDLGAHLSMGLRLCGSTLTSRMKAGADAARSLACSGAPLERRLAVATSKVLPKALYGVAATPIAQGQMASLRTAMGPIIEHKTAGARSLDLLFATVEREIDPEIYAMRIRATAIRRAWWKAPELREAMESALECYTRSGHWGCVLEAPQGEQQGERD